MQFVEISMINLTALNPYLRTKTDSSKLILIIEKLIDNLFKEGFNFSDILSKETTYTLKEILEKIAKDANVNMEDKKSFELFLRKLQEEISTLPIIHIMLSFTPKDEVVSTIHDWFYQNYKKTVLLDISVDPTLIGGSVLSFGGRANDYSLKSRIEQII